MTRGHPRTARGASGMTCPDSRTTRGDSGVTRQRSGVTRGDSPITRGDSRTTRADSGTARKPPAISRGDSGMTRECGRSGSGVRISVLPWRWTADRNSSPNLDQRLTWFRTAKQKSEHPTPLLRDPSSATRLIDHWGRVGAVQIGRFGRPRLQEGHSSLRDDDTRSQEAHSRVQNGSPRLQEAASQTQAAASGLQPDD